jgi:general secretion pathway protein H
MTASSSGDSRRGRAWARALPAAGFTLIELLVVLALVGLMAGLAMRGFKSLAKSDLRSNTAKLSGAMRYLFDRASTTGRYHRLVIDLEAQKYWAEVSDDRFYVPREAETEKDIKARLEKDAKRDEAERRRAVEKELGGGFDMSKLEPQEFEPKRVRFGAFKETTLKPVKLKNTIVTDVYTPRTADAVAEGRAYIYFFPLGQAEAAIVHLSDPDRESYYSLVVHPITGRVRIYNEYVKPPVERLDDAGGAAAP